MPPRKSTASIASAAPVSPDHAIGDVSLLSTATAATTEPKSPTQHKGNRPSTGGDADGEKSEKKKAKNDDLGIDDLLLPRTLTSRLSRGTLPPNTSLQRDALLALTKSATVFISYLAHNANNLTSRKTIQSQDILEALRETELWSVPVLGKETLGERVRAEVEKWEGEVRGKRKGYRDRVKARESTNDGGPEGEEEGRGPQAKRARRDSDDTGDVTMDVDGNREGEREGSEDAAAAQLRGESAAANGDGTETDPEVAEDEDEQDDEGTEDEQDEDEQDEVARDEDEDELTRDALDAEDDARRRRAALAPNGRVEILSEEESD